MKKILLIATGIIFICACTSDDVDTRNYRQDMRDFVQSISKAAKTIDPAFIIIPQNGHELLTRNGEFTGLPVTEYIQSIDGIGREDLFYGYDGDNLATPASETGSMLEFLNLAEQNSVEVMVTDYCWTKSLVDDSYARNAANGYISFAASHRALDNIPGYPVLPYRVNNDDIDTLGRARNFLYLLDPGLYPDRENFLNSLRDTNHDLLIIDLFFEDSAAFSPMEIESLKTKVNGGRRLVIAYMSIGEAEDYRYYWQSDWTHNPPDWIEEENHDWPGNYVVRYWDEAWQDIIYKKEDSYLARIQAAGFDGIYLDRIDAYGYFED